MVRPASGPTLFPYTTLFRSSSLRVCLKMLLCIGQPANHKTNHAQTEQWLCCGPSELHNLGRDGALKVAGSRQKDRKSTRLNSSHGYISYAVFSLKTSSAPAS